MLSDNWGEGGKRAQIGGEILETSSSDCDQEERLLWFYLGGWWKHFEIPASTQLWPHAPPRVLLDTSSWACARSLLPHGVLYKKSWVVRWRPCMGSLTELWVTDSEWALSYSCNVPSEKLFRRWPGPRAVACGTGMGDSQQAKKRFLCWTPFWFCLSDGQPQQPPLLPSIWRRTHHPPWSGGKFGRWRQLECERLENLLHRAVIWFWLFNFAGVTFEHHFELFLFLHVHWNKKKVSGCCLNSSFSLITVFNMK